MTIFDNNNAPIVNSAIGNTLGYQGRAWDVESGLWSFRNRMYSPSLGRFLQRDPSGYQDGINLYAFERNNPLKYLDAMGLSARQGQSFWDFLVPNAMAGDGTMPMLGPDISFVKPELFIRGALNFGIEKPLPNEDFQITKPQASAADYVIPPIQGENEQQSSGAGGKGEQVQGKKGISGKISDSVQINAKRLDNKGPKPEAYPGRNKGKQKADNNRNSPKLVDNEHNRPPIIDTESLKKSDKVKKAISDLIADMGGYFGAQ